MVDFEQVNAAELTQQFVGDTANRLISKPVLQENKARQIFRKTNISYHPCPPSHNVNVRLLIRVCLRVFYITKKSGQKSEYLKHF